MAWKGFDKSSFKINIGQFYIIDNDTKNKDSKIEFVIPSEELANDVVIAAYRDSIVSSADSHAEKNSWKKVADDFFRPENLPKREDFYTCIENRHIVEKAFLKKGIEILQGVKEKKENIRALGYSLPSFKDFGFGAMCFTWRNVPNNTPLVFWYKTKNFMPLFVKNQTNVE